MLAHTLLLSGKGAESLDRCRLVLIAPCGAVQASDYPFPKGREPRASCFSVESLSPQLAKPIKRKGGPALVRGGFSATLVIMVIMCVSVEELLC
jgi:hypothetical protein